MCGTVNLLICHLVCKQFSGQSSSSRPRRPPTEETVRGLSGLGDVERKELEYKFDWTGEHLSVEEFVRMKEQPSREVASSSIFPKRQFSRL